MASLRALDHNKVANIYQPKPRLAPCSCTVRGQCVIFAGRTDGDFLKSKEELSSTVEVFDQYLEQWRVLTTTGSPPKGLYGNVNSLEWNDGMERWSGLLEWSTGLDDWSATPMN